MLIDGMVIFVRPGDAYVPMHAPDNKSAAVTLKIGNEGATDREKQHEKPQRPPGETDRRAG
jgi:hypothetical protein